MRGKGKRSITGAELLRITPAYAGKRKTKAGYHTVTRDHPRLCGEKRLFRGKRCDCGGSPPPMRGKVSLGLQKIPCVGITPAYAGKRPAEHSVKRYERDHPRLCGEKMDYKSGSVRGAGSPPPMRGKADCMMFCRFRRRITPAYAGKSL